MRRIRTSLYPVVKEVGLTTDLAKLLAELAEVDGDSEAQIMRVALERLVLAYRRRGPAALRARSFDRLHRMRRTSADTAANAATAPASAGELNQLDLKA
jgi:hypothetical protein